MDVTPFLEIQPSPKVLFDKLEERGDSVRFRLVDGEGGVAEIRWAQFAEDVLRFSVWLRQNGLKSGDRLTLLGHNSYQWAVGALGCIAAGGVMVPIYPTSSREQLCYVIEHSDARFVLAGDEDLLTSAKSAKGEAELLLLPNILTLAPRLDEDTRATFHQRLAELDLDTPALMLYTSGTSGNPKGVPLTHRNVGSNAADWLVCNAPLLHEQATDLLWLPLSHIFGFGELCLGNTLGFCTTMCTPQQVFEQLPKVAPSVFMSVPAYWEKLALRAMQASSVSEEQRSALHELSGGQLQFCLSGGAGLKQEIKEFYQAAGILIIEGYGLTETSPTLTLNRPDNYRFDSVGQPLPSVQIALAEDGEILAKGPNVFSGYHKDPEASAAAFDEDGWFHTGDIGQFTPNGFLQIVDRKKDILVTAGGKNVPPANIELRFRDDPQIEHLVVYGDGKKYLVAGVWLQASAAGTAESPEIRRRIEEVNASLAKCETIKKFCIIEEPMTVENGLLTASLKVRRNQVYQRFRDQFEALYQEASQ